MREIFKLILIIGIIIQVSVSLVFLQEENIVVSVFSIFVLVCLALSFGLEMKYSYDKEIHELNKLLREENEQFHNELNEVKKRLINAALKLEEK